MLEHPDFAALQWDASGETLAVLPAGCSFVYTWTAATKELQKLETDFKASLSTAATQFFLLSLAQPAGQVQPPPAAN